MKRLMFVVVLFTLLFSACAKTDENVGSGNTAVKATQSQQNSDGGGENENTSGGEAQSTPVTKDAAADCLTGEEHPIAVSIADEFSEWTDYNQVIGWFCDGALFEDILNALTTEELTGVDAGDVLLMVAEGQSWEEIWLELGVTEE